jgi:thiamine-phosphate pyrophosphorylase
MSSLPGLWLCADLDELRPSELVDRVASVLATGPAVVWLRAPSGTSARSLAGVSSALLEIVNGPSALLVGDRVDVALALGAQGVHLTGRSVRPSDARRLALAMGRSDLLISQAVHDEAEVDAARGAVDAMVLSPFGEVAGKGPALGALRWAALRQRAPEVFAVALGGVVDAGVVAEARRAGADAVAVRRALSRSADPAAACAALRPAAP